MPISRGELRRLVAGDLRDLVEVTATAGGVNTLTDPVELVDFDGTQVSSQLLVTDSHPDNVGKVVRVIGNDRATGTITFTPDLPQPIAAGDTAELVNLRGSGFRVQEYHRAIKNIARDYAGYMPGAAAGPSVVFDAGTPVLAIPYGWVGVYGVHVTDADGGFWDMKPARYSNTPGWYVRPETMQVLIQGAAYHDLFDGKTMQLQGYARRGELEHDNDLCYLDTEWVRRKVAAKLAAGRGSAESNQWAVEYERMAAGRGPALIMAWEPNTVLLEELA